MIVIEREDGTKIQLTAPAIALDKPEEVIPEYPTAQGLKEGLARLSALTYTCTERYEDGRW